MTDEISHLISLCAAIAAMINALYAIRFAREAKREIFSSRASRLAEEAAMRANSASANQAETKAKVAIPE